MVDDNERRQRLQEAGEAAGPEAVEQLTRVLVHELANPLTVILAAFEALQTPDVDAAFVADIAVRGQRQAEHMAELLRDLREGGGLRGSLVADTRRQHINLAELVRDTCEAVGPVAAGRIVNGVPDDLMVWTVPSRLRQIMINLLANAAKYATIGPITVEATLEETAFTVDVLDRGPGVPPGDPEQLFELFRQGNDPAPGGMGVGLHVVRELAASLGGTVTLLPRPGGGTVARVVLAQRRDRSGGAAPA
ncbi:MAG TPA: HAMP domain-containing sensor histidine kinase [Acidimicrobiales bacterium]|nr:HAMP domain-containing sensor histidine kinase [Acidimicrobiales bacterium]